MKISKSWLDEIINFKIDTAKLTDQLTMVGLEVSEIKTTACDFQGVIVGEVLEVNHHPNADKLKLCKVNIGKDELLTIVCGATNVRSKIKVPVAVVGAELINNLKIKKSKIRGVDSCGMMCSAVELGLAEDSSGLLELPIDAPIGVDLRQYLALDDTNIEIDLTPDRGDCLSILGVAREISAINRRKIIKLAPQKILAQEPAFQVHITAKDACPHYCGRIIRGVNNTIATPIWLQERLRRLGIHPINPAVDIANYVMLELGQPLHAFDLSTIDRSINVRYATLGEEITLLSGNNIKLNPKTLIIADRVKPLAIAGIMGGLESSVNKNTTDIFLESAFFVPEKMAGVARSYGLQTDASYRYERGVDHKLQLQALDRATALLLEIVGGTASEVSRVLIEENIPQPVSVSLHRKNIEKYLGITIADTDVLEILHGLEMQVDLIADGWQVAIPSWRFDLKIEEDLIEEIARIYGYHRIPEQKIVAELLCSSFDTNNGRKNRLYELMTDLGYNEAITYSFIDPKLQVIFNPNQKPLSLINPISPELAVMRTSLWPGLINAAKYNIHRQQQRLRLFEIGLCFLPHRDSLQQLSMLAGIALGDVYPEQWDIKQKKQIDFFDLKNDVAAVLKAYGHDKQVNYRVANHPVLHPKRSAQIYVADSSIGFIGEIHPKIKQQLDLTRQICVFEIDLNNIISLIKKNFNDFSKFPRVQRDIAIIVDKAITWQQIKQKIVDISGELLHNVDLFDIYCGEGLGINKRSLGIRLIFQSVTRTLVDAEIDALILKIVSVLKQVFDVNLRG